MSSAGPGRREVAHRLFAAEYDDATLEYAESDEERAPNYVVTPSGARVNRLFVVGVLTAVEQVNDDTIRARIVDPTGAFVVYAGQYQPDELAALQSMESPAFVAVTGKANTFSPEGSDRVLTSVRPESVTEVDAETRDRWVVTTAEHTLARIQTIASALEREERGEDLRAELLREGVEPGFAEGVAKALDHYDTTADYLGALRDLASQALEVVAGERSEVEALEMAPEEGDGTVSAADLAELLGEDLQNATQAAEDVDPEVLLESEESGAGESSPEAEEQAAAEVGQEQADQEQEEESDAEEVSASTTGEEGATEAADSDAEEPVTDERAVEATAADAEEAAQDETADAGEDSGAEPETSESATEETAADAEAAAGADESEDEPAEAESGDGEMYEVDEEEREEIEEEYGVEFQSGTEVDPAGEAGIETQDEPPAEGEAADEPESAADDVDEASAEGDTEETDASADVAEEDESDEADETDESDDVDESDEDVDLEGVLLEEMDALDDGDGADREALQEAVAEATGADAEAIDDAIDDLLMSGQCYEPSEGTLKPI